MYLETADRLSGLLLQNQQYGQAIDLCQRILSKDNCWERAYRPLMLAYEALGERGQVVRTYQRCVHTLRTELDVAPSPKTADLYQELLKTT
jgi:LuxR family maltose regulon positive regulatory protein